MIMETRIAYMESKLDSTYDMVKEIHSLVIGTEHNRNDSMLSKIETLQDKVEELERDKIKREAKTAAYMAAAGFFGAIMGWLLTLLKH